MHAFARNSLLGALLLATAMPASADTDGINLPVAPRGAGGEDTIETAGGTRCRQSINSSGAYLDFGAAGVAAKPMEYEDSQQAFRYYSDERDQKGLLYVRVTVPLGKQPERLDCSRLYEIEIQRLRAELELMRMAAE